MESMPRTNKVVEEINKVLDLNDTCVIEESMNKILEKEVKNKIFNLVKEGVWMVRGMGERDYSEYGFGLTPTLELVKIKDNAYDSFDLEEKTIVRHDGRWIDSDDFFHEVILPTLGED